MEQGSSLSEPLLSEEAWGGQQDKKGVPSAFHISRSFEQHRGEYERTLFDSLLSKREIAQRENSQGITMREFPKGVSSIMLKRINLALAQELYNTSYKEGTEKENTGLIKNNTLKDGSLIEPISGLYSFAQIIFTLTGLTSNVFGLRKGEKPTNNQKNEVREALEKMDSNGIKITYPNGDVLSRKLIIINEKYNRKKDGAIFYNVILNPFYRMEIEKGTAAHPQDVMQRLAATGKISEPKLDLLNLLGRQNRNKPCERYKSTLLQEIGLMSEYSKNKGRVEEKLKSLFRDMQQIGLLSPTAPDGGANPKETTGANGEIKYIFYYNPDYIEKNKRISSKK